MEVFVRVVEEGSFSAAARRLGLTPSAVAKLIGRLEERLGVRLLARSTRSLRPTPEGDLFYEQASRILADIAEAEAGVSGAAAPRGRLRISASIPFGTHCVVPLLPEFRARFPAVTLDVSLTDEVVDILAERTDVAIRHGPLRDSSLQARKLGVSRRVLIAAPSYLERRGVPRTPADLADHDCLTFNYRRSFTDWVLAGPDGPRPMQVTGPLVVNNGETLRQAVLAGMGIGRTALYHVRSDLDAGRLVELLPEYDPREMEEIHALFLGRGTMPARVRAFIDFLVERLRFD
ncbi:LysR family transcriptional regulator [Inquilinus limosus]|uniref:LysR family transcriptional regulator n=1 Tax=Inquilinus limosus TaxID=171674 RepID=A0A211ZE69_9PROT|nr:LysR family transcriptional regulator [Inquilinus limosus]OWJ63579.1 LysR family transcriptional regulator [Inquilinus limosus]